MVTVIALQLVARWCFSFGNWSVIGGVDRELDGGVGLIRSVTMSCFVRRYQASIFYPLLLPLHRLCSDSNRRAGLLSLQIHLFYPFFLNLSQPPSSPVPPSCLSLSLRLSDGAYQRQNKQAHCVVWEPSGCREEACFFKTCIGYPFTWEMGLAGRLNASRQHGCRWNGDRQRHREEVTSGHRLSHI